MAITAKMGDSENLTAKVVGVSGGSGGGTSVRLTAITIYASRWEGTESPWSQVVSVAGVTPFSKVDLQPSVEQLDAFHMKDLAFVAENDDGVVTVFAIGDKPKNDYTIQATVMEVSA